MAKGSPRTTSVALRSGLSLPLEDERGLLASDINEMRMNETDELSVNEMGSEQALLLSYGKEKYNVPPRQAEANSCRSILHSL